MNKQEFLDLPEHDQNALISGSGKLVINFSNGNTSVSIHRLNTLFIRTTSNHDGCMHVDVHTAEDVLKLTQFSSDPVNLLLAQSPCWMGQPAT